MNTSKTNISSPILSVIIPTRNRAEYAISAIRSILNITSPKLELVVQDNSSNKDLEEYLNLNVCDSRMKYNHTMEQLDMVENFNRATEIASGEYITFIGDDDGVNPEIIDATVWAKAKNFDILLPTRPAQYNWPDTRSFLYGTRYAGTLNIKPFTGKISFPDAEAEMRKCAKGAGQNYLTSSLPKVYYGIVKKECMEKVRVRTGTYFPGPSPDVAGAMAVSNFVKRICKIDHPLFLPGTSGKSMGGLGAIKKHIGQLTNQIHLPINYVHNWSNLVPSFFSGETIWGEDVVQALKAIGRDDILRDFNIPLLHAMCAVFNPAYFSVTIRNFYPALRVMKIGYIQGTFRFIYGYFYTWVLRTKFLVANLIRLLSLDRSYTVRKLNNIEEGVKALTKYLMSRKKRFNKNL